MSHHHATRIRFVNIKQHFCNFQFGVHLCLSWGGLRILQLRTRCMSVAFSLRFAGGHPCCVLHDLKFFDVFELYKWLSTSSGSKTVRLWGMGVFLGEGNQGKHCFSIRVVGFKWTIAIDCVRVLCVHLGEGGPNRMATGMWTDDEGFCDRGNTHAGQDGYASDIGFKVFKRGLLGPVFMPTVHFSSG